MKISFLQLHILTYVLAMSTTLSMPAYPSIPPVSSVDVVDAPLIQSRELTVSTTDSMLAERQIWPAVLITLDIAAVIMTGAQTFVMAFNDNVVSSDLMFLIYWALTMIRSVVQNSPSRWSDACIMLIPHTIMLYATSTILIRSMGSRAPIGITHTVS